MARVNTSMKHDASNEFPYERTSWKLTDMQNLVGKLVDTITRATWVANAATMMESPGCVNASSQTYPTNIITENGVQILTMF